MAGPDFESHGCVLHCRFEPAYASIISGEDEGMFGWIAVNYLQGEARHMCTCCCTSES